MSCEEALAASEAEVKRLGTWVANRMDRDRRGYQKWREAHPEEHRRQSRESMARTRARRAAALEEGSAAIPSPSEEYRQDARAQFMGSAPALLRDAAIMVVGAYRMSQRKRYAALDTAIPALADVLATTPVRSVNECG